MTGILPHEVPAILEKGDQVLPRDVAQIERLSAEIEDLRCSVNHPEFGNAALIERLARLEGSVSLLTAQLERLSPAQQTDQK